MADGDIGLVQERADAPLDLGHGLGDEEGEDGVDMLQRREPAVEPREVAPLLARILVLLLVLLLAAGVVAGLCDL